MTPRKGNEFVPWAGQDPLHIVHPYAAGIDIRLAEHWVAVPPESGAAPSG